jgi:hypothetical protein
VLQAARTEIQTASFDINAPDGDDG